MAVYRADSTGLTAVLTGPAFATDSNDYQAVGLIADNNLTLASTAHLSDSRVSGGGDYDVIYSIYGFIGIPNNDVPARIYARVRVRTGGNTTQATQFNLTPLAPDRSGSLSLGGTIGPETNIKFIVPATRVWNTTTGDIDVSEDLVCSAYQLFPSGTAPLTNSLLSSGVAVGLRLLATKPTTNTWNLAELFAFEVWASDDVSAAPSVFGMLL